MKTIAQAARLVSAFSIVAASSAWAQIQPPAAAGTALGEVTQTTATVDAVDQATRTVTLVNQEGGKVSFVASPEVRNLAQLAKGDKVTITYAQAVAARLSKTTNRVPERSVVEDLQRTAAGEKPGGIAMREVKVVAAVEKVDIPNSVITLRGPANIVDVKVRDQGMLGGILVGDFVEATYTEAVAIDVVPGK